MVNLECVPAAGASPTQSGFSDMSSRDFKAEAGSIAKELGDRLEKLLEQHEAYLQKQFGIGGQQPPNSQSRAKEVEFLTSHSKATEASCLTAPSTLPGCPEPPPEPPDILPSTNKTSFLVLKGRNYDPTVTTSTNWRQSTESMAGKNAKNERSIVTVGGQEIDARIYWSEEPTEVQLEAIDKYQAAFKLEAVDRHLPRSLRVRPTKGTSSRTRHTKENRPSFLVIKQKQEAHEKFKLSCGIVHPAGKVRTLWNLISLLLICQDALMIPLLVFEVGESGGWEVFAWFCTLFWTADMFLSFRTGYFVGVKVEMNPTQIAKQYAMTWLPLDLFIVLFEWFSRFYSSFAPPGVVRTTRAVRVVRLVKLLRIAKMKDLVKEFSERIKSNTLTLILNVALLSTLFCVVGHFVACVWYALGKNTKNGWVSYDLHALEQGTFDLGFWYWYVSSTRWVVGQLNGRTDMVEERNMPERGFTVLAGLTLAVVGRSVFMALITKSMIQLSDLYKQREERRRSVNDYLSLHPIPNTLERFVKVHVREYKDIDVERRREGIVLALLPHHLQYELVYEVRKPLLEKHPLFGIVMTVFASPARSLCFDVIKQFHAVSQEMVFNTEDHCSRMLLMDTGRMLYTLGRGQEAGLASVDEGDSDAGNIMHKTQTEAYAISHLHDASIGIKVTHGMWVSEAALWVVWQNRGALMTEDNCCMLELDVTTLGPAIQQHTHLFGFTVVYERHFLKFLAQERELSDIPSFDVQSMVLDCEDLERISTT